MNVIRQRFLKIQNSPFACRSKGSKWRSSAMQSSIIRSSLARGCQTRATMGIARGQHLRFRSVDSTGYLVIAPAHCLGDPKSIQAPKA